MQLSPRATRKRASPFNERPRRLSISPTMVCARPRKTSKRRKLNRHDGIEAHSKNVKRLDFKKEATGIRTLHQLPLRKEPKIRRKHKCPSGISGNDNVAMVRRSKPLRPQRKGRSNRPCAACPKAKQPPPLVNKDTLRATTLKSNRETARAHLHKVAARAAAVFCPRQPTAIGDLQHRLGQYLKEIGLISPVLKHTPHLC